MGWIAMDDDLVVQVSAQVADCALMLWEAAPFSKLASWLSDRA
jgi:hypothetical protein